MLWGPFLTGKVFTVEVSTQGESGVNEPEHYGVCPQRYRAIPARHALRIGYARVPRHLTPGVILMHEGRHIPGLKKYQSRNPNGYFQDLDWPVRQRAYQWLHYLLTKGKRERGDVPQWLFAIYVGQARRLARNPPTSEWGRTMLAMKGGYAVQRRYRLEGRRPTEIATQVHRANARTRRDAKERERLGLPPRSRHGFTV